MLAIYDVPYTAINVECLHLIHLVIYIPTGYLYTKHTYLIGTEVYYYYYYYSYYFTTSPSILFHSIRV